MIIQFDIGNGTEVAAVFHAVIHGGHSLSTYGNTVNRTARYVIDAGAGLNGNRRAGAGIEGNRAVSTVNSYSRAVSTVNGNRTVFAAACADTDSIT